uniref:Uncharacterized protein n=1 Tax=Oryza brachyantha TaxID=4533 RepID=J3L795_ORYBR
MKRGKREKKGKECKGRTRSSCMPWNKAEKREAICSSCSYDCYSLFLIYTFLSLLFKL